MKNLLLSALLLASITICNAQITNIFPDSGDVGIGTTTPLGHLEIKSIWGNWISLRDGYNNDLYGFHNPNNGGRLELYISDGITNQNKFGVFTIRKSGDIGIGTSSPSSKLTIDTGATDLNMQGDGGVYGYGINVNTTGGWARNYSFSSNGTFRAHMGALGNNNDLTYLYFDTNNETDATGYATPEMVITKIGDVGIGTKIPSEKLEVNGNILSNKLMLNDPNRAENWNDIWQSGFYESIGAANAPEPSGWFWGLNMNHVSNNATYKYNGQIAIKNSSTSPTMYFRSTNREGIGTWAKIISNTGNQSINGKLEVANGNIDVTGTSQYLSVTGTGTGNYDGAQLRLSAKGVNAGNKHASTWFLTHRGVDGNAAIEFQRRGINNEYGGTLLSYRDSYGWALSTAEDYTSTTASPKLTIRADGDVGIGTREPSTKLEVNGDITIGNPTRVGSYINIIGAGSHQSFGLQLGSASNPDSRASILSHTTTGGISFSVQENQAMFLDASGKLGIGTPDTKGFELGVKGKIVAEEVKVAIYPWPDFIFENDYTLPTLKEVEQHIKEKGHLKDIPSAKDVSKNGIFLGEMNAKLLQKIEELTLYTIQQEEKINKQNSDLKAVILYNNEQEKRIKHLENKNNDLKLQNERIKWLEEQIALLLSTKK